MAKNTETDTPCINIIGQSTDIQGDIVTSGDMRIDGKLKGNVSSNQKLVVGQFGVVEGNITCKDCDISGKVIGNIAVQELLTLNSTADVTGDVHTKKLVIELDAQYCGVCKMGQESSNNSDKAE